MIFCLQQWISVSLRAEGVDVVSPSCCEPEPLPTEGEQMQSSWMAAPLISPFLWEFERVFFSDSFSLLHDAQWEMDQGVQALPFSAQLENSVAAVGCYPSHKLQEGQRTGQEKQKKIRQGKVKEHPGGEIWQEDEAQEYLLWRHFPHLHRWHSCQHAKCNEECLMLATQMHSFKTNILFIEF